MYPNIRKSIISIIAIPLLISSVIGWAQDEEDEDAVKPAWISLSAAENRDVLAFAEDYKAFMSTAKTELSFVVEAIKIARSYT